MAGKRPSPHFAALAVAAASAEPALATRLRVGGVAAVAAVTAVAAMFHLAAQLDVKRPVAVPPAVAAAALATHPNVARVAAVPPAPHLTARLRVKRPPTVRPPAAPFMNDNRYFGQNLHLKCMVAWDSTRPGDAA